MSSLAAALENEHREIDRGIEAFLAGRAEGRVEVESLRQAMDALRRHIFLEEKFLFPPLHDAGMMAPIFVMLREHGEIWDSLDAIDAQLGEGPGEIAIDDACRALLEQLEKHNAKEEPIVYPQVDSLLATSPSTNAAVDRFVAEARIPPGWRCDQAGISAPLGVRARQ